MSLGLALVTTVGSVFFRPDAAALPPHVPGDPSGVLDEAGNAIVSEAGETILQE